MAQNSGRKNYRVRYDRIIFVAIILVVFVLMLSSCISSCGKNNETLSDDSSSRPTLEDALETDTTNNMGTAVPSVPAPTQEDGSNGYTIISRDYDDIHTGDLILANEEHPCTFDADAVYEGDSPDVKLVTIKSILDTKESPKHYTAADWEVGLDKTAAYAMDAWFEGFYDATGNRNLRMIRGYDPEAGDRDFRTGRALTVGIFPESDNSWPYRAEGEYAWLQEHAAQYGFVLRYPEDAGKDHYFDDDITERRTASFRYVGVAAAVYMTEHNLCLEEFIEDIKNYSIDNMMKASSNGAQFGVYYIPASKSSDQTDFSVPSGDDVVYTVSGNNVDGFIITVALNDAAKVPNKVTPAYEDLEDEDLMDDDE